MSVHSADLEESSLRYSDDEYSRTHLNNKSCGPCSPTSSHAFMYGSIQRPLSSATAESAASLLSMHSLDENTPSLEGANESRASFLIPLNDNEKGTNLDLDEETTVASGYTLSSDTSSVSAWLPSSKDSESRRSPDATRPSEIDIVKRTEAPVNATANDPLSAPFYLRILGFDCNPVADSPDLRLAMLSNLSTSYNVVNVSCALQIMLSENLYREEKTPMTQSVCSSALIAGMMLGQLVGGAIGDAVGRHLAMTLVMSLQIVASIGSAACFTVSGALSIFDALAIWRFLLGIGCGGVYPLAATLTAESITDKKCRGKLVALTFSMQGVGYIIVPITGLVLIAFLGENSDWSWRLLLGFGAIPGIMQIWWRQLRNAKKRMKARVAVVNKGDSVKMKQERGDVFQSMMMEKDVLQKLCGTAGTWFLFDVLFYGNTLFSRVVLKAAFGSVETISASVMDTLIVTSIALPGYFVSVARVGTRDTPKYIQLQGFALMAVLYLTIGIMFSELAERKVLLLLLYGSTFLFANFGPNSTTFMLPSMTFSSGCRSTMNGISAATGKLGALLGASCFEPVAKSVGDPFVMILCGCISILGFYLTYMCVNDTVGQGATTSSSRRNELEGFDDTSSMRQSSRTKKRTKRKLELKRSRHSAPSLLDW